MRQIFVCFALKSLVFERCKMFQSCLSFYVFELLVKTSDNKVDTRRCLFIIYGNFCEDIYKITVRIRVRILSKELDCHDGLSFVILIPRIES